MSTRLNELVQITRAAIREQAKQRGQSVLYNYDFCHSELDKELLEYYFAVKILRDQEQTGETCICEEEINVIESAIYRILGPNCKSYEKDFVREDSTEKDAWLLQNPTCVAYDYFADYLEAKCALIDLDLKIIIRKCSDIGIDLKITDRVVCDAVDIGLKITDKTCKLDIDVKLDLQKCLEDFTLKLVPLNCDITFQTYLEKVSCGTSLDVILSEIDCAADVKVGAGPAVNCPV